MEPFRLVRTICLTIFVAAISFDAAKAQPIPYVPPEFHQERRRLQEDTIRFCIWEVNPTSALDRDVAEAIGAVLLLDVEFDVYESRVPLADAFWETVFIHLAERCDALTGFKLVPGGYPDWLTPSRPYYDAPYLLAVTDDDYERLGDIPPGEVIGAPALSEVDYLFQDYLRSLPESRRWRRFPYTSSETQIRHLQEGVIAGAFIWEPSLRAVTEGDPASLGVRTVAPDPLPRESTPVGMILREHETLLRSMLDDAIAALVEDGVMDELLERHGYGESVP